LRILFDHNVDRRFRNHLPGHEIQTTRERGWDKLANSVLLKTAADAGFEGFISIDKNLEHEQNLRTLPLPVIVIDSFSNALPALIPFAAGILDLLQQPLDRILYVIQSGNIVLRLTTPRP
jgi:hypothetical protein